MYGRKDPMSTADDSEVGFTLSMRSIDHFSSLSERQSVWVASESKTVVQKMHKWKAHVSSRPVSGVSTSLWPCFYSALRLLGWWSLVEDGHGCCYDRQGVWATTDAPAEMASSIIIQALPATADPRIRSHALFRKRTLGKRSGGGPAAVIYGQ